MRTHVVLSLLLAGCLLGTPGPAGETHSEEALPSELEQLPEILDDEAKGLERIRQFDQKLTQLAHWDFSMARQHYESGEEDAAETKIEDAMARVELIKQAYETFLERHPDNARAHNYLGELLYDLAGDEPRGVEQWLAALELEPDLAMAHNNLAIHFCHIGEYEEGFRHLDKALELDPENPDFLFNAVQIYFTNTPQAQAWYDWDDATIYAKGMELSKKALELDPEDFSLAQDYAVNFFGAERFGVAPDWEKAADAWKRARELAPYRDNIYMTWLNEARVSLRAEDYRRAEKCLEEALEIHPDSAIARQLLDDAQQGVAQ